MDNAPTLTDLRDQIQQLEQALDAALADPARVDEALLALRRFNQMGYRYRLARAAETLGQWPQTARSPLSA